MEGRDNMSSGVTVIGAEVPSNYHVAPSQGTMSSAGVMNTVSSGISGIPEKKKRGRPRKYAPDGSAARVLSPAPVSASAPPAVGSYPGRKRGRGKSGASIAKQQAGFAMVPVGEGFANSYGANFTPHMITVNVGEDVTAKVISFCQQGPRAICILSAHGMVSNATLRQSDSCGGTLTYEGRFEIVNLCGSFTPTEREGTRYREGGLSVSLSCPNGQVVGGCVAGLLIAATPVQIIVGSFLPTNPPELKPKKQNVHSTPVPVPFTITAASPPTSSAEKEPFNSQGHTQNLTPRPPFTRDNWPNNHAMQERRISGTDINISLYRGMQ